MTEKFITISSTKIRWLIIISFLIALIVDSMIMLNPDLTFLPPFTLLMVLYWSSHVVDSTYMVSAFILGTLADALYQTTLGAHALLYIIIVFMMLRIRLQFKTYPAWQQAFIIGIYLLFYQALHTLFFSPVITKDIFVLYWTMPAAGILIWPLLEGIMNKITNSSA